MPPGLLEFGQASFASGMWRAVARHEIPADGAYDMRDVLIDDYGMAYRRGPVSRLTSQVSGGPVILGLWDMLFTVGRRTFGLAVGGKFFSYDGTTLSVATGLTLPSTGIGIAVKAGDIAWLPGAFSSTTGGYLYGGAPAGAARYAVPGTVTSTKGSATLTAGGLTNFTTGGVQAGMLFTASTLKRAYVVKSVDSSTQITLTEKIADYETGAGAHATAAFEIFMAVATPPFGAAAWGDAAAAPHVAIAGGKVWLSGDQQTRVYQSAGPWPATGESRYQDFTDTTAYHEFPSNVVALAGLRDRLFVFTQDGLYVVSGCALDLVDSAGNVQQRVERITDEVLVRSASGVALAHDLIVAAGRDGCYIIDSLGTLQTLTRSITPYWQAFTQAGSTPGVPALYRGHLFVPFSSGDVLVCRVDRPQQTRAGIVYPWTRMEGYLAGVQAFAVRDPTGATKLIAGGDDGYVYDVTKVFAVDSSAEGDGSVHQAMIETGAYELGGEVFVQDVRLDYALGNTGSGAPTVMVEVSKEEYASWSASSPTYATLAVEAPENWTSHKPVVLAVGKACRRAAFRFTSKGSTIMQAEFRGWAARFRPRGRRR